MTTDQPSPNQPTVDPQSTSSDESSEPDSKKPRRNWPVVLSVLLGITLPLAAICAKELCAESFFDPAPTKLHVAVLLLVPLYHACLIVIHPSKHRRFQLDLFGAVTIGIALVYSVLFAPILPIALLATIVGLGFLPLAPYGALVASLNAQWRIYRSAPHFGACWYARPRFRTTIGVVLGLILPLAPELPSLITEHGLVMAASSEPARAVEGVRLLRRLGDREVMLAAADDWGRRRTHPLHQLLIPTKLSPAEAKQAFYRVTGESAEAVSVRDQAARERYVRWDPNRGSSQIGPVNDSLELVASRIDGSVNGDAALGYAEWTMVFRNHAPEQAEARARVALPPGAVVSRVTLWIDGEPRDAAFGGRAQTRQAYQAVVSARRDPLLVTMIGPDLIQVQCFPVPPVGEMKILVGLTIPFDLERLDTAVFTVPRLVARNFAVSSRLEHRVWLESKQPLWMAGKQVAQNAQGAFILDTPMNVALSGELPPAIVVHRLESRFAWTEESKPTEKSQPATAPAGSSATRSSSGPTPASVEPHAIIEEQWAELTQSRLERLAIVIDSSSNMGPALEAVAGALPALDRVGDLRLLLTTDDGYVDVAQGRREPSILQAALRKVRPLGGVDSQAALLEAATWARGATQGVVLWIHGPQPVALGSLESLKSFLERSSVRLVTAQALPGEHVGLAEFGMPIRLEVLPRRGALQDDLRRQFSQWSGSALYWVATLVRRTVTELPALPSSSGHLGRLWAYREIERTRGDNLGAAQELAVAYRLVTPVSGAVVLENAAQYSAAKLEPGSQAGSPSVPEPETWAMLIIALGFILWQLERLHQRRKGWQVA